MIQAVTTYSTKVRDAALEIARQTSDPDDPEPVVLLDITTGAIEYGYGDEPKRTEQRTVIRVRMIDGSEREIYLADPQGAELEAMIGSDEEQAD